MWLLVYLEIEVSSQFTFSCVWCVYFWYSKILLHMSLRESVYSEILLYFILLLCCYLLFVMMVLMLCTFHSTE